MINVKKDLSATPPMVFLDGIIDENMDFDQVFSGLPSSFQINCRAISRINSMGISKWRSYFSKLRKAGGEVKFWDISPALLTGGSLIADFILKSEVCSIYISVKCLKCPEVKHQSVFLNNAKAEIKNLLSQKCHSCSGELELDEVEDLILNFYLQTNTRNKRIL